MAILARLCYTVSVSVWDLAHRTDFGDLKAAADRDPTPLSGLRRSVLSSKGLFLRPEFAGIKRMRNAEMRKT